MFGPTKLIAIMAVFTMLCACGASPEFDADTRPSEEITQDGPIQDQQPEPVQENPVEPKPEPEPEPEPVLAEPEPVSNPQTVSAYLAWDIPAARENGDDLELSDIGGYILEYKLVDASTHSEIVIEDQTVAEYSLEALLPGQYEFRVATFDTSGLYGDFTNPVIIDLQ